MSKGLSDAMDESDLSDFHKGSIARKVREAKAAEDRRIVLEGLEAAEQLFNEALPQFNWGASALSANAIKLLNEVPAKVRKAIEVLL